MRAVVAACALLAGCFLKPDRPAGTSDSGTDGTHGDAPPAACSRYSDWTGPQKLPATIDTGSDEVQPALSPDGTHLLFERYGDSSMWMSTVNGTTFEAPSRVLPTCGGATWTPDGNTVYAVCDGQRTSAQFSGGSFTTPTPTVEFTAIDPQGRLTFSGDGSAVYYETGGTALHIARATGSIGHTWAFDRELTELETGTAAVDQKTPWIASDEREIFFSTSNGNAELRTASRATPSAMFSAPAPLAATQLDGERPTLSRDGTLLIYNGADFDLYYATRTCLATSAP